MRQRAKEYAKMPRPADIFRRNVPSNPIDAADAPA
jgi:hypothetical protein